MTPRRPAHSLAAVHAIWEVVLLVPPGRVATYGQVAHEAGLPGRARLVGKALKLLPDDSPVPWHRVLNASGRISLPAGGPRELQSSLLSAEGVEVREGRVDLKRFRWHP